MPKMCTNFPSFLLLTLRKTLHSALVMPRPLTFQLVHYVLSFYRLIMTEQLRVDKHCKTLLYSNGCTVLSSLFMVKLYPATYSTTNN